MLKGAVLYERKSRVGNLYKLDKKSGEIAIVSIVILKDFNVKTITCDTDLEFAKPGFFNDLLGNKSYFCES
jgi:IS30 family transposase